MNKIKLAIFAVGMFACGVSAFGAVMDGEYDKATFFSMGLAVNAIAYGVTKAEMEFDE